MQSVYFTTPADWANQIVKCHTWETCGRGWGLTPLQRCSRCILQPQLTGQIRLFSVISRKLGRERKKKKKKRRGSYPSAEMQSVYFTTPADWANQIVKCHTWETCGRGWGLTPLQRCSRCILQPQLTGQIRLFSIISRKLVVGDLPLYRVVVGVFYRTS